jgi:hypothetical protein
MQDVPPGRIDHLVLKRPFLLLDPLLRGLPIVRLRAGKIGLVVDPLVHKADDAVSLTR